MSMSDEVRARVNAEAAAYTRFHVGGMQPVMTTGELVHEAFRQGAEWWLSQSPESDIPSGEVSGTGGSVTFRAPVLEVPADAPTEPTEPAGEWEYTWRADKWILDEVFGSMLEAQRFQDSAPGRLWVRKGGAIIRRRKAGPWEPVE